jgi:hypothetical protein
MLIQAPQQRNVVFFRLTGKPEIIRSQKSAWGKYRNTEPTVPRSPFLDNSRVGRHGSYSVAGNSSFCRHAYVEKAGQRNGQNRRISRRRGRQFSLFTRARTTAVRWVQRKQLSYRLCKSCTAIGSCPHRGSSVVVRVPKVTLIVVLVGCPMNGEVVSRGSCPSTIPCRIRFEVSASGDLR